MTAVIDTRVDARVERTLAESIYRTRHALRALHDPASATVLVHGRCPEASCRQMNFVEVHADTRMFTCKSCGRRFLV
jgi:ethanolamine ammonia-lyase small subunit